MDLREVQSVAFSASRVTRDRLQGVATRLAATLAGCDDAAECFRMVAAEVNAALDSLSLDFRSRSGEGAAS